MNLNALLIAIGNTLLATAICLSIAIPIGMLMAILTTRSNALGRKFAAMAMASQLAVPLYVFAGGWAAGVGLQGWLQINHWLGPTGIGWMQSWLGSLLAVSLIHALACLPWVSLILSLGLVGCDRNEEEMALLDGGWPMLIRHIWFPRLRIWIRISCLWCAMGLLTEMVVSNLYMFRTVAEMVYLDVSRDTISPLTYLAGTGLCALPLFVAWVWVSRRLPSLSRVLIRPQHYQATAIELGKYRIAASVLMWSLVGFLVGLPILNVVMKSGWTPLSEGTAVVGHTWTFRRFVQTAIESVTLFQTEFYWSAMLAVSAALVALLTSSLLRWLTSDRGVSSVAAETRANRRRGLVHLMMILMVAIPGPMVAILVSTLLNRPAIFGQLYVSSLAAPVLAQQFRLLPMAWLMVNGLVASIPRQTWELAATDGLSRRQKLQTVLAPAIGLKLVVAGLLLMLFSIGELSCSMGVLPPGVTTTSMRLFEILHFGMRHQDSGLCGLLFLLGWLAAGLMRWTLRDR